MDEIDRESFAAKLSPIEVKGIQMTEAGNIPLVRDTPAKISLDGTWQLAEGGSEKERLHTIWTDQIPARVPGSIHTALVENEIIPDPYIGQNDSIAENNLTNMVDEAGVRTRLPLIALYIIFWRNR